MRALPLVMLATALHFAASGCKEKSPTYKRSTPIETINSFRRALEAGRIPADTDKFFLAANEKVAWKLRCKARGCNRGNFTVLEVESEDEYAAKYIVDYAVFGNDNIRVLVGTKSPITFALHEGAWYFDQIGEVTKIKIRSPAERAAKSTTDPDIPSQRSDAAPQ